MKKCFFLCLSVFLLSCSFSWCNTSFTQINGIIFSQSEVKGSPAFEEAMKMLDQLEKRISNSTTCDDLRRCEAENKSIGAKYFDAEMTENEREQLDKRRNALSNRMRAKAREFDCN